MLTTNSSLNKPFLTYRWGDATKPHLLPGEIGLLTHIVNDVGAWGAGFVVSLNKSWPELRKSYLDNFKIGNIVLGKNIYDEVENNLVVVGMCAQRGIRRRTHTRVGDRLCTKSVGSNPIRYNALSDCLAEVGTVAFATKHMSPNFKSCRVHMPMIGSGLAGGDWSIIETIIQEKICSRGIDVIVYRLDQETEKF